MDTQFAVLSPLGELPVPAEIQEILGLRPGSRLAVMVKDGKLIAEPADYEDIRSLRGILSSERGMVEELQNERRTDKW